MTTNTDSTTGTTAPQVGDFATYTIGSDSYPVELTDIRPRKITTRAATAVWAGARDGDHEYSGVRMGTFTVHSNAHGKEQVFTLRGDGAWRPRGVDYGYLTFGVVRDRRDPSF